MDWPWARVVGVVDSLVVCPLIYKTVRNPPEDRPGWDEIYPTTNPTLHLRGRGERAVHRLPGRVIRIRLPTSSSRALLSTCTSTDELCFLCSLLLCPSLLHNVSGDRYVLWRCCRTRAHMQPPRIICWGFCGDEQRWAYRCFGKDNRPALLPYNTFSSHFYRAYLKPGPFSPTSLSIWVISPIIDKLLYLTLFDLATTSWVFTIT